jgi:stage V sporulation protein AD
LIIFWINKTNHFSILNCGELIYNICEDEYQGGSGAGCSSVVFNSYVYDRLIKKEFDRVLLVATGALLSSVSSQQGESIPGIAHAVEVES